MNSSGNNKRDFIIIGGCHVSGFGSEGSPSFVDVVESKLNLKCVYKKSLFQLKNVQELTLLLDQYSTNLVFLQVGNYEFDGSLRMLSFYSKYRNKNVSGSVSGESDLFHGNRSKFNFFAAYLLKLILVPFIWRHAKRKNEEYLFLLQKLIISNKDKTFVIITPLPCYHTPTSAVRRKAGILYRRYFSLPNTIFIDSYDKFEMNRANFYNRHHLSAKGHEHLGNKICKSLNYKDR